MNQPQIPAEFHLLTTHYPIGDLLVDLYGELPDSHGGYNVCALALAGTTINQFDLVPQFNLDSLSSALNAASDFGTLPAILQRQAA